jgi:hypothetical protein
LEFLHDEEMDQGDLMRKLTSTESMTVAASAAETIARRAPTLWLGLLHPTPRRMAEATRMITEKQLAFCEGLWRFNQQVAIEMTLGWLRLMTGRPSAIDPYSSLERISAAASLPGRQRVKANVRRLRRKRSV